MAGPFRMTIGQRINRSLDERAWALVADKIPSGLSPVSFKSIPAIDAAGVRWLRDNEPGYFRLLATALTERPAKPSIMLEDVRK